MSKYSNVVIDYGHGLTEPHNGKRYTFDEPEDVMMAAALQAKVGDAWVGETVRPTKPWTVIEGAITRGIAWRLFKTLAAMGITCHDALTGATYKPGEVGPSSVCSLCPDDVPLEQRSANANTVPDSILISIHANAVGMEIRGSSQQPNGASGFTSPGDTAADPIATTLINAVGNMTWLGQRRGDWSDGDPDHERRFWMLMETDAPAVLMECGFFTNVGDASRLCTAGGQEAVAWALATGLSKHLASSPSA